MPKRRPNTAEKPLDIFDNPRLSNAMAAATGLEPVAEAAAEPAESAPEETPKPPATSLRSVPSAPVSEPETAPSSRVSEPDEAPKEPPKAAPKEPPKGRKGRAQTEPEVGPALPPEPNVPLKFRVPQNLRSEFQTFKAELSAALGGVALDDSNLGRPLLEHFLLDQRDRILEAAGAFRGELRRPANGDAVGMAEFDHTLGEIFREARKRRRASPSSGGSTASASAER